MAIFCVFCSTKNNPSFVRCWQCDRILPQKESLCQDSREYFALLDRNERKSVLLRLTEDLCQIEASHEILRKQYPLITHCERLVSLWYKFSSLTFFSLLALALFQPDTARRRKICDYLAKDEFHNKLMEILMLDRRAGAPFVQEDKIKIDMGDIAHCWHALGVGTDQKVERLRKRIHELYGFMG